MFFVTFSFQLIIFFHYMYVLVAMVIIFLSLVSFSIFSVSYLLYVAIGYHIFIISFL